MTVQASLFPRGTADVSPCGRYRYRLERSWIGEAPVATFVMLNPSTADAEEDDPTIRRCVGFAKSWKCGGIAVVNLFAFRSTDARLLRSEPDPVGPDNDAAIIEACATASLVIAAWGDGGPRKLVRARAENVTRCLLPKEARVLGLTKDGFPRHPLFVKGDRRPLMWESRP